MTTIFHRTGQLIVRGISLLFTLVCLFPGCSAHSPEEKSGLPAESQKMDEIVIHEGTARDLGIAVVKVQKRPLQSSFLIPARLLPDQNREAVVGSLVHGRVQRVLVNAGDQIRKGDELMLIEGLEIGEIKAAFIKAKAHLQFTEAAAKRQRVLHEQNIGSDKALLEAEAEYQKARAEFTAEDRKIHSIGLSDNDVEEFVDSNEKSTSHVAGLLPVRSPLSGVVAERNVVQGQMVDATTNAFRIIDTGVLWADGQMQEQDLGRNASGLITTLTVNALPGRSFKGKVIFVSPVIDPQTRTVTVRAEIPNAGNILKPNMFGELHLGLERERMVLTIPENAVVREKSSVFVFVAADDTLFSRRTVTVGTVTNGEVEVSSGIEEGERIVVNGSFLLKSELARDTFGQEE